MEFDCKSEQSSELRESIDSMEDLINLLDKEINTNETKSGRKFQKKSSYSLEINRNCLTFKPEYIVNLPDNIEYPMTLPKRRLKLKRGGKNISKYLLPI